MEYIVHDSRYGCCKTLTYFGACAPWPPATPKLSKTWINTCDTSTWPRPGDDGRNVVHFTKLCSKV